MHTPGPWTGSTEIKAANGVIVAEVFAVPADENKRGRPEADANAALISTAPELLAMLKSCLPYVPKYLVEFTNFVQNVVKRAEG